MVTQAEIDVANALINKLNSSQNPDQIRGDLAKSGLSGDIRNQVNNAIKQMESRGVATAIQLERGQVVTQVPERFGRPGTFIRESAEAEQRQAEIQAGITREEGQRNLIEQRQIIQQRQQDAQREDVRRRFLDTEKSIQFRELFLQEEKNKIREQDPIFGSGQFKKQEDASRASEILPGQTGIPEGAKPFQFPQSKTPLLDSGVSFGIRDIELKGFLESKPIPEGKISPAGYLDYKVEEISERLFEKLPEGKIKSFLGLPSPINLKTSELLKFGFFAPVMGTTTEVLGSLTAEVSGKSAISSRFVSEITKKGDDVFNVRVLQQNIKTDVELYGGGSPTSYSLSKQTVIKQGDDIFLGAGKGTTIFSPNLVETKFVEFDIIGGSRTLGKSSAIRSEVFDYGTYTITKQTSGDTGTGVFGRSFSQATKDITQRQGLRIGVPEFDIVNLPVVRVSPGTRGFSTERIGVLRQDIFGTIKRVGSIEEGSVFKFAGQTGKPTTRISSEGISLRLKDLNVRGTILEVSETGIETTSKGLGGGLKSITKTETKTLTPEIQESVVRQVGGSISQSKQLVPSTTKTPILQGSVLQSGVNQLIRTDQKISFVQPSLIKQDEKIKTSLKFDTLTIQRQQPSLKVLTAQIPIQKTKQDIAQKVLLKQAKSTITKQRFTPRSVFSISSPSPRTTTPRTPITLPPLTFGKSFSTPSKSFTVEVRRGGIFKPIATTKDIGTAFAIGRGKVSSTLAATFRISGQGKLGRLRTPSGFRQKAGGIFIEKRKFRLGTPGEKIEIQRARRKKKVTNRKKGGKK